MGRAIGSKGLEIIKKWEGLRLKAYTCPAGVLTIGYGHTKGVKAGDVITEAQAVEFLISDCQASANYVDNKKYVPHDLNDNQRDALISFTFNCGPGNLKNLCQPKGRVRTLEEISKAIPLYNKGGGKVLPGLVKRRAEEKALFDSLEGITVKSYPIPTRVLKYDDRGDDVKWLQDRLNKLGIKVDGKELKVDGSYGNLTRRAVAIYQLNIGLAGIMTAETLSALNQ